MDEKQPKALTEDQISAMFLASQAVFMLLGMLALVLDKKVASMALFLLWAISQLGQWYWSMEKSHDDNG